MELRVGKEVFGSKKELAERIRRILHGAAPGIAIPEPEHQFLMEVLKGHPEAERKTFGVEAFRVVTTKWGNRCFEILYVDGTCEDFSFMKCLPKGGST